MQLYALSLDILIMLTFLLCSARIAPRPKMLTDYIFLNLIVLSLKIYVVDQDNIFSERRIPVKSVVVFFMHQDRRSSRCISQFLSSR